MLFVLGRAVRLHKLGKVHVPTERAFHGAYVGGESVACELDSICKARRQIGDKQPSIFCASLANPVGDNEFGVCIDGGPGPNIPNARLPAHGVRYMLLLRVAECPNFIDLDALAVQSAHSLIMEGTSGCACIYK
jgi:hypothetical protein